MEQMRWLDADVCVNVVLSGATWSSYQTASCRWAGRWRWTSWLLHYQSGSSDAAEWLGSFCVCNCGIAWLSPLTSLLTVSEWQMLVKHLCIAVTETLSVIYAGAVLRGTWEGPAHSKFWPHCAPKWSSRRRYFKIARCVINSEQY